MPIRVLVVDDVPDLRALFRLVLESDDRFEVVGEAGDGEEAIVKAHELRPDVVMLDIAMPRMNGINAIPLLHQAAPGIRILVLSGFETDAIARRAIDACATAFISKGVSPKKIVSTLHDVYLSPPKTLCGAPAA
jgi:DNA-binding NarL/FixJ family response regulator